MNKKIKFACGVIFYNPKKEEVEKIYDYLKVFDKVFVIDNSTEINKECEFLKNKNFEYIFNNHNFGLSKSYNILCNKAYKEDYKYVCLLDQDSIFSNHNINAMINEIKESKNEKVGIFCPRIIYNNKSSIYNSNNLKKIEEINWCISSGSFLNLDIYNIIKGFDENYFIDRVDADYCFQLKKKGYKILIINNSYLEQELGTAFSKFNKIIFEHSPLRNYYIFRNRLYFYKKNKKLYLSLLPALKHIWSILLYEHAKKEKLKYILKGGIDFYKNRLGEKIC